MLPNYVLTMLGDRMEMAHSIEGRVPFLDHAAVGDHKVTWEINRHQWLVTLAQAWRGVSRATFGMDLLVAVGALSAFGLSTANLLAGSLHLYYDTACMLITLVLLGKILERRAKDQVLEGLEALLSDPARARAMGGWPGFQVTRAWLRTA